MNMKYKNTASFRFYYRDEAVFLFILSIKIFKNNLLQYCENKNNFSSLFFSKKYFWEIYINE